MRNSTESDNQIRVVAHTLWRERKLVGIGTLIFVIIGTVYLILAPRVYTSGVILFPKEIGASSGNLLASASLSLNPFQNTALSRLEILLKSEEISEKVIAEENLLPILFKNSWDEEMGRWKDNPPHIREATRELRRMLQIGTDIRNNYLEVMISSGDPYLSVRILNGFLRVLNEKIRNDAQTEMKQNREFLKERYTETDDPYLRERIQQLEVSQIESFMRMSANAFQTPEAPVPAIEPNKPRKMMTLILFLFLGLTLSSFGIILYRKADAMGINMRLPGTRRSL